MGTLCDPDPKSAPKSLLYLSYTTCDEMIKKGPYQVCLSDSQPILSLYCITLFETVPLS